MLVAWVKEKITWTKSGRESAKREVDQFHMLENAARDEKREKKGTGISLARSSKPSLQEEETRQRVSWKK